MRADTPAGLAFQPDEYDLRGVDVPGVPEELLYELSAAFADTHITE